MNNEEQDTQPQASQAEGNSSTAGENGASMGGSETAEMSEVTTFATDETVANDGADAGAGDAASEGAGSTHAESSTGGADMASDAGTEATDNVDTSSDTGATSGTEESTPAEILAGEARDDQDAQLPGVGATSPDETEAAPQIAQASETSQAEGEPIDQEGSLDTAAEGVHSERASSSAYQRGGYGGGADGGSGSDSDSSDGDYEEPIVRSNRLQDVAANASMEDLLRASEQQYRTLKHGDVVEGSIMKVGREEILVDIGAKTEGIVPSAELQSLTPEEREALAIGDTLLVSVVQPENNEGHAVLSLDRARQERSWRDLQKRFEGGEVIQARVTGYNKGGLLVNLEGVRGFVPSSQISSLTGGNESTKQSEMAKLQGQTIPMKIIEINRSRNRLILSERQAKQEERESVRSRLLRELEPGQIRLGRVSSICDFGAFVDIGGADGLIHLSEISWKRVNNPKDVLSVGDQINVYVLSVDPNERKIALSLKRTQPEPWSTITENYTLGQIVHGTITQLTTFGAFARLEDGIEGLIHVSELAEGRVAHPKNVVNVGDALDLKVIRIDPVKRRIGLSLKRVNEDENAAGAGDGQGMGVMEDGDETAPNASATRGATGDYDMAPMGQVEVAEASSLVLGEGDATAAADPQADARNTERMERFARTERPDRNQQQRQQRERDRDRGQNRSQGGGGEGGDEPIGALAQALGAFMNRDADDEEDTTATAQATPDAAADAAADTTASIDISAVEDTATDTGADTSTDASTDAGADAGADDTTTDVAEDAGADDTVADDISTGAAVDDTASDVGTDMQDEAATETTDDTSTDTAVDSPVELGADTDSTADASTDEVATETETVPEAAVETVGESASDVQDEAAPDSAANTEDEA